jgi:hypothetical protein
MLEIIKNAFRAALQWIKNIVKIVIDGVLNFAEKVVGYFKNLKLTPNKHVPFIANKQAFVDKIKNATVKNVGIFQGIFNKDTNEFEHVQDLEADSLDQNTKEILGNEELVVLS